MKPAKQLKQVYMIEAQNVVGKALHTFLNTQETQKRHGNYFIDGNGLYFRTTDNRLHTPILREHIIALKVNGIVVGNSSVLPYVEAKSVINLNKRQTEVQRVMSALIPMMPFGVFEEAKLDVSKLKIVERGTEETISVRVPNPKFKNVYDKKEKMPQFIYEKRHYTGACLFRIGKEYFLFDIDRREIEHGVFNAFLVNLGQKATSIAEAYENLKPKAVKDAEAKGTKVLRQGEWFFIPVDARTTKAIDQVKGTELDSITLQAGPNRPNYAEGIEVKDGKRLVRREMFGNARRETKADAMYLTGKVEHSGREHETLMLKGWYTAVPNTAIKSFTLTGDVD